MGYLELAEKVGLLVTKLQLGNANREALASRKLEGSWSFLERLPS